jgi:hypothetical protein
MAEVIEDTDDFDSDDDILYQKEPNEKTLLPPHDDSLVPSLSRMQHDETQSDFLDDSLIAITNTNGARSSISATFRGYCSELFVFGTCHRKDTGCSFDNSAAGQERCIQSFNLLAKRELASHANLPPWTPVKPAVHSNLTNRSHVPPSRPDQFSAYPSDRSKRSSGHADHNRYPAASASSRSFHT